MSRKTSSRSGAESELGVGLIGTLAGTTAFLVLLLFAAQLLLNLYATSTVTAAAFDAARVVAGEDGGPDAQPEAERQARALLGRVGERARFSWSYVDTDGRPGADHVALRVQAESPSRLLPLLPLPYDVVDRTVTVRVERPR